MIIIFPKLLPKDKSSEPKDENSSLTSPMASTISLVCILSGGLLSMVLMMLVVSCLATVSSSGSLVRVVRTVSMVSTIKQECGSPSLSSWLLLLLSSVTLEVVVEVLGMMKAPVLLLVWRVSSVWRVVIVLTVSTVLTPSASSESSKFAEEENNYSNRFRYLIISVSLISLLHTLWSVTPAARQRF